MRFGPLVILVTSALFVSLCAQFYLFSKLFKVLAS